jgi:TonB-linked SusC/RagA family outer membrane protein
LAGAQILLEGTERGVLTNAQGRFRFEGIQRSQVTLQVVMIGYQTATQTVAAGNADVVIVLRERAVELDELVVTGTTGAVQKRALGNTVATLDAAATMRVAPAVSLSELLTAKTPGLSIRPAGGAGVGARLKIRGTASLTLDTQPLVYIDGVRADNAVATGPGIQGGGVSSRLNDINPEDIESIEIIKGPAAATLYGTEASSGVIQIITKKGRPGDMTVGMVIRQGINWFPNPEGVFPLNWYKGPETGGELRSLNVIQQETDEGRNVFRNGYSQGYSLSLQGGTAQVGYYFSGDFDRTEGYDPSNLSSRYAGRTNLSLSPHPTIDLNANLGLTVIRTRLGREESPTNSIYGAAVRGNPRYLDTPSRGFYTMPPEVINSIYFVNQDVDRFITSVQATHRPLSWLTERLAFGVDFVKEANSVLVPNLTPDLARFISATAAKGSKSVDLRNATNTTVDYGATATWPLLSNWSGKTSVGFQYYRKFLGIVSASGQQFPAPGVTTVGSAAIRLGSDDYVENVTVGTYVQQEFSLGNRLFLTGAVRADDNSAFGKDFNIQVYPKVSASWVLSEEPFWSLDALDVFRLRAAFGESGQQPDAFAAIRTFAPVTGTSDLPAASPQSLGNSELGPERGQELEAGFEASLLDNRLGIDFTFYHQVTKDAILLAPVAPSSGFPGSRFINAGEVRNQGAELLLTAQTARWNRGGLDVTVNLSTNDSKIISLNGLGPIGTTGTAPGGPTAEHREGYAPWSFFVKKVVSAELNPDGTTRNALCDGGPSNNHQPVPCAGAPTVYIGKLDPSFQGSVAPVITLFDRLRIRALVDFQTGRTNFAENDWARCSIYRICRENVAPTEFSPERIAEVQLAGSSLERSIYYVNADFAKLRELSLSYSLPDDVAGRVGARNGTVTVAGRNLHTWTSWPQFDPESTKLGLIGGFDQAIAPPMSVFMLTVNLTF